MGCCAGLRSATRGTCAIPIDSGVELFSVDMLVDGLWAWLHCYLWFVCGPNRNVNRVVTRLRLPLVAIVWEDDTVVYLMWA